MLTLEEIKKDRNLVNDIDWDMTPEMAVRMYLEWGNIWPRADNRKHVVRSKSDYSIYFVLSCLAKPYYIYLIKINSRDSVELAKLDLPDKFEKTLCVLKGLYAPEGELKEWLKKELNVA